MRTIILTFCLLLLSVPIYGASGTYGYDSTAKLMVPSDTTVRGATVSGGTIVATNTFVLPRGASPTTSTFGWLAADNDAWAASRGALQFFDGTANTYVVGVLASDTPSDGQVPKWNTGGTITWEDDDNDGGTDANAIHDNVAGEINAITEKASPVSADLIIIEDSEDSNNKKKVQVGNLPASGGSGYATIEEEGSAVTQRTTVNFVGGGVTVTDDAGGGETDVTITRSGIVREMWIDAADFDAHSVSPALFSSVNTASSEPVWLFDQDSAQSVSLRFALPQPWDLGDIKVKIYWSVVGGDADGGDVRWQASLFSAEDGESMALASSAPTVDDALVLDDATAVTITDALTLESNARVTTSDAVLGLLVSRLANLAADDLTSDAYFWGVKIQWTESATEPTAW